MNLHEEVQVSKKMEEKDSTDKASGIQLRPFAGDGWWLGYLLPAAYLINCLKFEKSTTLEYKYSAVISFGLVLQTEAIHFSDRFHNHFCRCILHAVPPMAIFSLFIFVLNEGVAFSVLCGVTSVVSFQALFWFILRRMPNSFTYGEASIVVQGFVIFLANLYFKLIDNHVHISEMEQLSAVLQIGLMGVTFMVGCCYFVQFFRGFGFYVLLVAVGGVVVLFPIDDQVAIIILIRFLTMDLQKVCMIALNIGLIGMTVGAVGWQMSRNEISNTRTRKIFHILIVLVFVPGLIYQCAFLFVASGIALALLVVLETMRIIRVPPFHGILEQSVKCFIDEKDAGLVAVTPIYLLIGCSAPIWLHPCPCDLTDSAGFELLKLMAGVISVGIGDTAASIVGSKFGKIKWWNCQKTVEGTIAGIVAQALIFPLFIHFGFVRYSAFLATKFSIAITTSSLVETFTNQVDNLVLPLVTFIILSA